MGAAEPIWTVQTDVFDGPLDLLLYLVRRDGIELADFPVRRVTEAYLDYLDRMRELHLGIAGEYLVMAATLVYLKSLELLPRQPTAVGEEEDGEDPREALARQLREYKQIREAADALERSVQVGREVFVRAPQEVDDDARPIESPIDAFGLLDLFYELLTREAPDEPTLHVGDSGPDVVACCAHILEVLRAGQGKGELAGLLQTLPTRTERVVSFVAVLEMARLQWVDVMQEVHLGPVSLTLRSDANIDLTIISGELVKDVAG